MDLSGCIRGYSPYGVNLPISLVISTDVPPPFAINPYYIFDVFHHRGTDVQGKIGTIVMAFGVPTFLAGIFARFFVAGGRRR
jgi:hypothetical protein